MGLTNPATEYTQADATTVSSISPNWVTTTPRLPHQLGPEQLALADAVRHGLLRHRVHGHRREPVRHRPLRHGAPELLASPGRRADLRRPAAVQAGAGDPADLGPDAPAQVVASRWAPAPRRAASSTTTRWCRASTPSSRSTSTFPDARRGPKGSSTASGCCRRRSWARASPTTCSARRSWWARPGCSCPPDAGRRAVRAVRQFRPPDAVHVVIRRASRWAPHGAGRQPRASCVADARGTVILSESSRSHERRFPFGRAPPRRVRRRRRRAT